MTVAHLTRDEFSKAVLESEKPVLVDFYADWCGPCRMLAPVLEKLAAEVGERASIVKVNVDEQPGLAQTYGVSSIPTLILFRGGLVVKQFVGLRGAAELREAINQAAEPARHTVEG